VYFDLETKPLSGLVPFETEGGELDCAIVVRTRVGNSNESQTAQRISLSEDTDCTSRPKSIVAIKAMTLTSLSGRHVGW
jgi:hypothetical protein